MVAEVLRTIEEGLVGGEAVEVHREVREADVDRLPADVPPGLRLDRTGAWVGRAVRFMMEERERDGSVNAYGSEHGEDRVGLGRGGRPRITQVRGECLTRAGRWAVDVHDEDGGFFRAPAICAPYW